MQDVGQFELAVSGSEHLMTLCRKLHDSILRELHIVNRNFFGESAAEHPFIFDGRVYVQAQQMAPGGVEFVMEDVIVSNLSDSGDIESVQIEFNFAREDRPFALKIDLNEFSCKRLWFREWREVAEPTTKFGGAIPVDPATATRLKEKWIQCGNCADAWQYGFQAEFVLCPACGRPQFLPTD